MNRILVIDDEPQIRRFLRISLTSQGFDVIESANAEQGLANIATETPDLIVLDLGLPDMDGQDLLVRIREFYEGPIIVLSVRNSESEKVQALDAGANDYVVKPFGIKEFLARVRGLLKTFQGVEPPPAVYDDGHLMVDLANREVELDQQPVHLSRKEFELLRMLLMHRGRIVTQQHLLDEIWGPSHIEDTHYLRVFIAKLRTKLDDDSTDPRYIETEPGVGYRFLASETG